MKNPMEYTNEERAEILNRSFTLRVGDIIFNKRKNRYEILKVFNLREQYLVKASEEEVRSYDRYIYQADDVVPKTRFEFGKDYDIVFENPYKLCTKGVDWKAFTTKVLGPGRKVITPVRDDLTNIPKEYRLWSGEGLWSVRQFRKSDVPTEINNLLVYDAPGLRLAYCEVIGQDGNWYLLCEELGGEGVKKYAFKMR